MSSLDSDFLERAIARVLELAERAPDIATDLRRFADDLQYLAAELEMRRDGEGMPQ